jgi:hypothetical protein
MSSKDSKPHTQPVGGLPNIRKYSMLGTVHGTREPSEAGGGSESHEGGKFTALEVPMWPTPASQGLMLFKGWGIIPLILNPDDAMTDSEEVRKELFTFLNRYRGNNKVPNIASYYDGQAADWRGTERRTLKTEELLPEFKGL